jgi:hypothetical protein
MRGSQMGFIIWICRVLSSNQSTGIRTMDLGAEEETVAGLGDQMTSHGHLCYQGWQDSTLTLASKTDRLIMGGALYMGMCGALLLVLPTVLFALKS